MRCRASLLAACLFLPFSAGALDLTPTESWRPLESFRVPVLIFTNGAEKVRYQPPGDWRMNGGGNTLSFYPGQQGAFMQFRVVPRPAVPSGAAEDAAKFSRALLPPDAQDITLAEQRPSPFTLEGRQSQEFIYDYSAGGQRYRTSIALCDLDPRERFVVIITARPSDFKPIHEAGLSSLFSWTTRK